MATTEPVGKLTLYERATRAFRQGCTPAQVAATLGISELSAQRVYDGMKDRGTLNVSTTCAPAGDKLVLDQLTAQLLDVCAQHYPTLFRRTTGALLYIANGINPIPCDPLRDLNIVHAMEQTLSPADHYRFVFCLKVLAKQEAKQEASQRFGQHYVSAPAHLRLEALLRGQGVGTDASDVKAHWPWPDFPKP